MPRTSATMALSHTRPSTLIGEAVPTSDFASTHLNPALVTLEDLGPQLPGERGFPKRMRLHQSWWRSAVLGLSTWGQLPRQGRRLGSLLSAADGAAGYNFLAEDARRLYETRRLKGWGVEPDRCTKNLMSSQTLTFNMLGTIAHDHAWGIRSLGLLSALPRMTIEHVAFEGAVLPAPHGSTTTPEPPCQKPSTACRW